MTIRLAINGFGRIGRCILRAWLESDRQDVEIVAVNSRANNEVNAHLLRYDTIYGKLPYDIIQEGEHFIIKGKKIFFSSESDPLAIKWQNLDIDIALECTGVFTSKDKASAYLKVGAKKVLVSAPSAGADRTVVYGVNHQDLTAQDVIISNGSCTTNCLAPIAKILDDAIGIKDGFMTTIHSYTGDQPTLDRAHRDLYRARAAACSIIPTTTGAAKAVGLVLPNLAGKLDGVAVRVPTPNVSLVDLTFNALQDTTIEEINGAIMKAANTKMKNIVSFTEEKLVSSDFIRDPHSAIFHNDQTRVLQKRLCRVVAWYDNEWGFSNRMLDNAIAIYNAK